MRNSIVKLLELFSQRDLQRLRLLFLLTLVVGVLEVAGLASVIPFLQLASSPDSIQENGAISRFFSMLDINDYKSQLVFTGWSILVFLTLSNTINALSGWTTQRIGWTLSHDISMRLVSKYLNMPYVFFLEKELAEMIKSATADINNLINNVVIASCHLVTNLAVVLLVIILLAAVQPIVALASFCILSISFLSIFLLRKNQISALGKQQLSANTGRFTTFTDLINGIKAIQSSNAHRYFYNRFDKPSFEFSVIQPKVFINSSLPKYVIETLVFGSIILMIVYLTKSNKTLSDYLPIISLYVVAGYRLLPALNRTYISATLILAHHHVIDSIHQDYAYTKSEAHSTKEPSPIGFKKQLALDDVSFAYTGSESMAINDVSLLIEKGSKVAFVGTSGSGKSTLGAIVVGLIQPLKGSILIDKTVRETKHQSAWVDQIGYVPQEVFLYNGSVADNVCFGLPERTEDVVAACKIAQIHDHIVKKLPQGYASMVGDSGIRLSGGQKQRIGIARAIYRNPELLLLDEATSALDTKTEKLIFDAIYRELSNTTLVVIAHRVSTVKKSDQILLLEDGSIVARGTFDELINKSELFRELSSYI